LVPHKGNNEQAPIFIIDAGARGGIQHQWISSPYPVAILGFEPDEDECRSLNKGLRKGKGGDQTPTIRYFPYALDKERGRRKLYLYRDRRLSSFFHPNMDALKYFPLDTLLMPDAFAVDAEVIVECVSLDECRRNEGIPEVDFIKLDTQGSELGILQGGSETLSQAFGVAVEVAFVAIYEGQPLFSDVDTFLRERGFSLFDLNRHWWKRDVPPSVQSRGQMIFADALYLRDIASSGCDRSGSFWHTVSTKSAKLVKTVVIASLLGYSDYGMNLLDLYRERKLIDERTYDSWRSSYITVHGEWKPDKPSLWQRGLRMMYERFSHALGLPADREQFEVFNARFYDNDESKDYR